MARYVQQPDMSMPNDGGQVIHHFVKTFVDEDPGDLDTQVNVFLITLEALLSTPIIRNITFTAHLTAAPMPVVEYASQVHYVLVE